MKSPFMTHDLSCALGQLAAAARRYPGVAVEIVLPMRAPVVLSEEMARPAHDLVIAAVAFTIQLAIDEGGCDPAEMRVLERDLFAALEARR